LRIAHGRSELEQNLYFNRVALAYREIDAGKPAHARELLDACPIKLRDWEWFHLNQRCYRPALEVRDAAGPVFSLAISPNNEDVAVLTRQEEDEAVSHWKLTAGGEIKQAGFFENKSHGVIESIACPHLVAFSTDGRLLASVTSNR